MVKNIKRIFAAALAVALLIAINSVAFARVRKISTAPTGLSVTNLTSSEVDLGWNAVSGASGYKVYAASPYDSNYSQIATVYGTSYKNTSLKPSTSYWYYVVAYNKYGSSPASLHITAKTLHAPGSTSSKRVLGFATYYYSGDTSSYNSMTANSSSIDEIDTYTYTTDGLGNITGTIPSQQLTYANSNGIKAIAMISNNFDGNVAKTLLENSGNRQTLISNILSAIKANNYKGVNVDFEGVYYYDRSYLTSFMNELYNALHPQGYTVNVCVPAKTSDSTTNSWNGAFDYAQIASFADSVIIMAYDEHYSGGQPGPIASIGWVQNVVNYAVTVIPRGKIILGVAAYGYDWSSSGTKAYSINGIYNLASTYGATVLWDSVSQSPYFTYTDNSGIGHTVWFENGTSLGYKLDIVNSSNLAGIAIWRLGLENADYWSAIHTKLSK